MMQRTQLIPCNCFDMTNRFLSQTVLSYNFDFLFMQNTTLVIISSVAEFDYFFCPVII